MQECSGNIIGDGFITVQGKKKLDTWISAMFLGQEKHCYGEPIMHVHAIVIFMNSVFTDIVKPEGWDSWNQRSHK